MLSYNAEQNAEKEKHCQKNTIHFTTWGYNFSSHTRTQ